MSARGVEVLDLSKRGSSAGEKSRTLDSFKDAHRGERIVVCGCGVSLNEFDRPQDYVTIGVNDISRLFDPTYLVVVDPRDRFKGDRFSYVETSRAKYLFTQVKDLGVAHPAIVPFELGEKDGTELFRSGVLNYGVVTPYVALCLAVFMGASRVGLIGVDFTDHHFFGQTGVHEWTRHLEDINRSFSRLNAALRAQGVRVSNLSMLSRVAAFQKQSLKEFADLPEHAAAMPCPPYATAAGINPGRPSDPEISVVVVSLNEGDHLQRTVESLTATLPNDSEIIIVDDGSTDGSTDFLFNPPPSVTLLRPPCRIGSAAARNLGARHARGGTLVFSDAHVSVPKDWSTDLLAPLRNPDVGATMPAMRVMRYPDDYIDISANIGKAATGFGMRWTDSGLGVSWLGRAGDDAASVPLLGAGFMAIRRNLFAAIDGFDQGIGLWGSEDAEISIRMWALGFQCLVVPTVEVSHMFRKTRPYDIDWETVLYNKLRLATVHFTPARQQRVVEALASNYAIATAFVRLLSSDADERRTRHVGLRRFDDDWFFDRFSYAMPDDLVFCANQ